LFGLNWGWGDNPHPGGEGRNYGGSGKSLFMFDKSKMTRRIPLQLESSRKKRGKGHQEHSGGGGERVPKYSRGKSTKTNQRGDSEHRNHTCLGG